MSEDDRDQQRWRDACKISHYRSLLREAGEVLGRTAYSLNDAISSYVEVRETCWADDGAPVDAWRESAGEVPALLSRINEALGEG